MSSTGEVHGPAALLPAPSVVTIGNFDGVHRGHQVLLRRAVDAAADRGVRSVAVTFDPHPAAVLRPDAAPPLLQSVADRCEQLAAAGVDEVLVLPFSRDLADLDPEAFVAQVLAGPLGAVRVIVGTNFRFGRRAAGDVVTLVEQGEVHGFTVEAVTLLELAGTPISSSAIRAQLAAGDVAWAAEALGRPYTLAGTVVHGDGRGRTIGVPTANLDVPDSRVLPADGVYAADAEVLGERLPAVVNVGVRPTFDGTRRTVEAHLIDTDRDLYGHHCRLRFVARLRGEQRFADVTALTGQIAADIAAARAALS